MKLNNSFKKAILELKNVGIETSELDARVLLSAALEKDSVFILNHPENLLTNREYSKFRKFIRRRKRLEPVAYILGHKEFYGNDFQINKNVLVPRPETEFLVEYGLNIIKNKYLDKKLSILDMGTGSGCIIISIAKELENVVELDKYRLFAVDNSKKALYVAKKNARIFGLNKNIKFYKSNIFSNNRLPKKYDIVIANLPYVPIESKNKGKSSIDYEPEAAIFAKHNGTEIIIKFLDEIKNKITAEFILLELDPRNIEQVRKYTENIFKNAQIEIKKDLAGKVRYLLIENIN